MESKFAHWKKPNWCRIYFETIYTQKFLIIANKFHKRLQRNGKQLNMN